MLLHPSQRCFINLGNWINGYNKSTQNNNGLNWIKLFSPVKIEVNNGRGVLWFKIIRDSTVSIILLCGLQLMAFISGSYMTA